MASIELWACGRSITDSTTPRGAISPDQTELGFRDQEYPTS